jgi:hypothetical protein
VIKHLTKRIRGADAWRQANIVWRGDSHYGRVEAMDWCDENGAGYIFGLAGNARSTEKSPKYRIICASGTHGRTSPRCGATPRSSIGPAAGGRPVA